MVYQYKVITYAWLVRQGKLTIDDLPVEYQVPVAEYLLTM